MRIERQRPEFLNIDVLALSLLCCLLASVIGLIVMSAQAQRIMLGTYKGPYVLLECIEDAAIIYPGGSRIGMYPSRDQLTVLVDRIAKASFVAFAVRPSGWFGNSYNNLRTLLDPELEKVAKETGRTIRRTAFPLDSADPISVYLPPAQDI